MVCRSMKYLQYKIRIWSVNLVGCSGLSWFWRQGGSWLNPPTCSRNEVSVCSSAACRIAMDHSDCCEQTLDDFSVLYTSPNVGSAYKRICFQSTLPFSPLVPRLKYIMVQLMMKGWLCSSGRRGEENDGEIFRGFPQHYKKIITAQGETSEGASLSVCVRVPPIFIQGRCKWSKTDHHPAAF